jgi:hypothetical protein
MTSTVRTVLIDGSNVALNTAAPGKLKTLDCLENVLHALVASKVLPYTLFDASFRYRMPDDSAARKEFERLTQEVKQYFQMSPKGKTADLFLIELAATTGYPIISNDTFQEFGGVKDGVLSYQDCRLEVHNFQVIAGTVVIPDLRIRFRFGRDHPNLDGIEFTLAMLEEAAAGDAVLPTATTAVAPSPGEWEIDAAMIKAIRKVIGDYVKAGGQLLSGLGPALATHKEAYLAASGFGKTSKRACFGFPRLGDFVQEICPEYRVQNSRIVIKAKARSKSPG